MNPSAPAATQMIMAGGIAAASLVATMVLVDPVPQPPAYHLFADTRQIAGIPNALNTLTNVPFLLVGAYGMALCFKVKAPAAWLLLFISVAFVSAGSAWYHLAPTMASLVWDRLPMAVGFMGLFVALLSEYVDNRLRQLLLPAAALGFGVVLGSHGRPPSLWLGTICAACGNPRGACALSRSIYPWTLVAGGVGRVRSRQSLRIFRFGTACGHRVSLEWPQPETPTGGSLLSLVG